MTEQSAYIDDYSWKDELIKSEQEARAFLERELKKRGIAPSIEWEITSYDSFDYSSFKIAVWPEESASPVFYASGCFMPYRGSLVTEIFSVSTTAFGMPVEDGSQRNKNLSLIGLKTLIGTAQDYIPGMANIYLKGIEGDDCVEEDGPRFWAHLGGLPVNPRNFYSSVSGIKDALSHALVGFNERRKELGEQLAESDTSSPRFLQFAERRLKAYEDAFKSERYQELLACRDMARDYPFIGFRMLARIKRSREKFDPIDDICKDVIDRVVSSNGEHMRIELNDPGTLKIMRERLGALPCCPAPMIFSEIAHDIAQRDGDRRYFEHLERDDSAIKRQRKRYPQREF